MNPPDENEIKTVSDIITSGFWDLFYHEYHLALAYENVAFIKTVIVRCAPNIDLRMLEQEYKEGADDEDDKPTDIDDFFRKELFRALSSVKFHEQRMVGAHPRIAGIKAMVLRGGYKLDLDELEKSQVKRVDDMKKRDGR